RPVLGAQAILNLSQGVQICPFGMIVVSLATTSVGPDAEGVDAIGQGLALDGEQHGALSPQGHELFDGSKGSGAGRGERNIDGDGLEGGGDRCGDMAWGGC